MVKNNHRKGFSLAEALISMLILSIFFGIAAKMVTQRPKQEYIVSPHGFFECYEDGGTLKVNGTGQDDSSKTECEFTPAKNATVYNLVIYFDKSNIYYRILYEMNYKLKITFDNSGKIIIENTENSNAQESLSLTTANTFLYKLQNIVLALLPKEKQSEREGAFKYGSVEAAQNPMSLEIFCSMSPNSPICRNTQSGKGGSTGGTHADGDNAGSTQNDNSNNTDETQTGNSGNTSSTQTDNQTENTTNKKINKPGYEKIDFNNFKSEVELVTPKAKITTSNGPGIYISW